MQERLRSIHLVILICLAVFVFSTHSIASQKDGLLRVHFLDVGQGDAIFIETPSGNQVLVDGGPDNRVLGKLGEVMPFYDKDIDLVIASHPHADHIVGLMDVIGRYDVENIIEARESYDSSEFSAWRQAVAGEGAENIEAVSGKIIDLGDGVVLKIIHPFVSFSGEDLDNPHEAVVAAFLEYGELRILLTGDMEERVERRLIAEGYDLDSDILKVGHHGSKTSTSEAFLSAVSPETAVIQVGPKNRYGHPSPEVLERLENYGIKIYRNDVNGGIKLVSDGINYLISTQK